MASPTQIDFIETPLQDVIDFFKDYHGIEIQIDTKALNDCGIDATTPVTKNLKGVSLRSALKLMLRELNLTYVIQDGVLLITRPEEAETRLTTVVYPVGDLVSARDPTTGEIWSGGQADYDSLIDLITSTVQPTTWDDVGGPGSISPFPETSCIVLSQTQDVHEQVDALLATLRRVSGGKIPVRAKPDESTLMGMGQGMGGGMNAGMGGFGGQGMGGMGMSAGMGGMGMGGMGTGGGLGGMPAGMNAGMGGGMGGTMGGGMGGPSSPRRPRVNRPAAARNAPPQSPYVITVIPVIDEDANPESADLLEGVRNQNRGNQVQQSQKLKGRYEKGGANSQDGKGMGGVNAGGFM